MCALATHDGHAHLAGSVACVLSAAILRTDAPLHGALLLAVAWSYHPATADVPALLEVRLRLRSRRELCSPSARERLESNCWGGSRAGAFMRTWSQST